MDFKLSRVLRETETKMVDARALTMKACDHHSVSSICNFARCPRLYCWKKVVGIERPSAVRDLAMTFGSAVHAGAPFTWEGNLAEAMVAFKKVWGEGDSYEDKKRTSRVGMNVLASMCSLHSGATWPYEVLMPVRQVEVESGSGMMSPHEIMFEVDMGLSRPVTGRIDATMRRRDDGTLWLMEYKTSSQLWGNFADNFIVSPQVETYGLAMKVSGAEFEGAIVEGLLVSKTRTDESIVPVSFNEEALSATLAWWRWQDQRVRALEESVDGLEDPTVWSCERSACTSYAQYGQQGWVCEFQPLCMAGNRWHGLVDMYELAKKAPGAAEEVSDVD
jgi:hypothetical protein